MAKTTAANLQDEIEMIRREAFAAGYAAAMKFIREYASRLKPDSAMRPLSQRRQESAAQPAPASQRQGRSAAQPVPASQRQGRSAARSSKIGAPARRSPRGTNARLIVEVLEAISPRAARPSEIRKALRDKGSAMATASIHFALGQLKARHAVEHVAESKTWRYLGKAE